MPLHFKTGKEDFKNCSSN